MGLVLAREYRPDAVLVFAGDGRSEVLLSQLKQHPETRHRPVFVAGPPVGRLAALRAGAAAHLGATDGPEAVERAVEALRALQKRTVKRLTLIRNGSRLDPATMALLGGGDDVDVIEVAEEDALDELRARSADCAVLPLGEDADSVFALLEQAAADDTLRELPLIIYTPEPLGATQRRRLEELATHVNAKAVSSPERLVDETALFLHRMEANMPAATRKLLSQLRTADSVFRGKRILIVDDDIRNVFALTSALEMRGMKVLYAENGREGIAKLREAPDVDLVLLDVMMPEMDGYETARSIRAMTRFEHLPIISLTAKAMKGDRDKCIAAGASDYITKPVDMDQLLSLMRVWLR
jgi:CheY-like chemotaxis protein